MIVMVIGPVKRRSSPQLSGPGNRRSRIQVVNSVGSYSCQKSGVIFSSYKL